MIGHVQIFVVFMISAAPLPQTEAMQPTAFLRACRNQEAALAGFVSNEANWRPQSKAELLVHLRVVGVLRPKAVIAKLLPHIGYRDDAYDLDSRLPIPEFEFPVYGALKKYGAAAIPELIAHLKRTEEPDDKRQAAIEASLAALLLRDLSDDREIGKAMARARIQAEFNQFPKADFPRLKAVLARPILR